MHFDWKIAFRLSPVFALAAVAPNAFPAAMAGVMPLHELVRIAVLPAAALLIVLAVLSRIFGSSRIALVVFRGAVAGAIATFALELVRYPGFLAGFMPGNLPDLIGVLLLNQFASGPSTASSLAGFGYHFWNGACFGILFVGLAEVGILRETARWTTLYGFVIGLGFMLSPVVQSLGVGYFGVNFGWSFAATVTLAHVAFGLALFFPLRMLKAHPFRDVRPSDVASPLGAQLR